MGDAVRDLQEKGLKNPLRVRRLIEEAIAFNRLDLTNLTVFTEVGSGNCVTPPIIAALAGANHVFAMTQDSRHGKASEIAEYAHRFAEFCAVRRQVEVVFEKTADTIRRADIVTNLGFVRPIDREMVGMMKQEAVIPLMYEAWEFRPSDIDLDACREKGIPVAGTNEDFPGLDLFTFAGPICMKMLFEVGVEVYKSKIIIISHDKFGESIKSYLIKAGAEVGLFTDLASVKSREFLRGADVLLLADYIGNELLIGLGGQIAAAEIKEISPSVTVVLFAGLANTAELAKEEILYNPQPVVRERRMYHVFADLGPKPHIDLMTAGLKVGELMIKNKRCLVRSSYQSLMQMI